MRSIFTPRLKNPREQISFITFLAKVLPAVAHCIDFSPVSFAVKGIEMNTDENIHFLAVGYLATLP
jgi:hypothetical protein